MSADREQCDLLRQVGEHAFLNQMGVADWTVHTPEQARVLAIARTVCPELAAMTIVDDGHCRGRAYTASIPGSAYHAEIKLVSSGLPVDRIIDTLANSPRLDLVSVVEPNIFKTLGRIGGIRVAAKISARVSERWPEGWFKFMARARWTEADKAMPDQHFVLNGAYLTPDVMSELYDLAGDDVIEKGLGAVGNIDRIALQALQNAHAVRTGGQVLPYKPA